MGCELSTKYPKICKRDEALFEELLSQYCGENNNGIASKTTVENYGLVSFSEMEEKIDRTGGASECGVHWTDILEIFIISFIVIIIGKFLWGKLNIFRHKRRAKQMESMRVFYRQALMNNTMAQPTAPVTIPIQQGVPVSPRVTPYTPVQEEIDRMK